MAIQIGSWGTPEFGITEAFGKLFGAPTTNQGGSNISALFGSQTAAPTNSISTGGQYGPPAPTGLSTNTGAQSGQVLGVSTGAGNRTQQTQSNQPSPTNQLAQTIQDNSGQMRGDINSKWDSYVNQLNDMLNQGLPGQRTAQEQIANESYTQGVNQLGTQKAQSEQEVQKQQAGSLKDLAANVKNLFQAGNINLGQRGASDSSAADQYSYAVTKIGTKARGDILSQANDRINQIGDIYKSEVNRLESDKNTRVSQIADWFNNAQNTIRQQIGQAGLGRGNDLQNLSQNIYNQALSALQGIQAETANRRASLESWAASNSKDVQSLVANMQAVQQMPGFQGINSAMPQVTPEGNMYVPTGYGQQAQQKKDIFGNPIQ